MVNRIVQPASLYTVLDAQLTSSEVDAWLSQCFKVQSGTKVRKILFQRILRMFLWYYLVIQDAMTLNRAELFSLSPDGNPFKFNHFCNLLYENPRNKYCVEIVSQTVRLSLRKLMHRSNVYHQFAPIAFSCGYYINLVH